MRHLKSIEECLLRIRGTQDLGQRRSLTESLRKRLVDISGDIQVRIKGDVQHEASHSNGDPVLGDLWNYGGDLPTPPASCPYHRGYTVLIEDRALKELWNKERELLYPAVRKYDHSQKRERKRLVAKLQLG